MGEEKKVVEKPRAVAEREVSATFRVPVEVTQEEMLLTWTVENREERPCCFWLNYIPTGGDDCDSVILPCRAEDTTVLEPRGLRSSLQVECGHRGRYTLHIEGSGNRGGELRQTWVQFVQRHQILRCSGYVWQTYENP